ncbi:MAG: adenylate/guanylate cyclase domain-containing protein [Acidobacteriota bacterium]|nr:adenylate/guanylate cyclase domain-containing protein [Acidobacteriota bacterium]
MDKKLLRGLAAGTGAFALAAALGALGAWRGLELKSWDARIRFFADRDPVPDIALILVDQPSLNYFKTQNVFWPWPRQMYAPILGFLKAGGARSVFMDIVMSEPSAYAVEDDEMLATALRESGNVVLPVFLSREENASSEGADAFLRKSALEPGAFRTAGESFRSATVPIPVLAKAARGGAEVHVEPDPDGIFRRMPLATTINGRTIPSVALSLSRMGESPVSGRKVPVDRNGAMLIRYRADKTRRAEKTIKAYSAAAVIDGWLKLSEGKEPEILPNIFAGKNVLIGLSGAGLLDMKTSPISRAVPGAEIQAAALDTLLRGRFLRPPAPILDLLLGLVFAIGAAVAITRLSKPAALAAAAGGLLILPFAASLLGFAAGRWTAMVQPMAAVLIAVIGAAVWSYAVEGRQKRFLRTAFRHYLSPHVVDQVAANPALLRLGGERREITSFFSDVAGFTSISESLGAEGLVALLNEYLSAMSDIILDEGGTLDKYEGDAIVAFWNAPLDSPDHALRACRAALACQAKLAAMGPSFESRFGRGLRARIGLNTGPAVVGNMGSVRRFDYTAMGDTVNLAARLEGACKPFGISILAGEATIAAAGPAIVAREVDCLRVVGKSLPTRIFEVVGRREDVGAETPARLAAFQRVLDAYRKRAWAEAESGAAALVGDPVAAVYAARCAVFRSTPPPPDWDFVFELKTK